MASNFSGPLLELSANGRAYFRNMPLGNDPDYVHEMIDFLLADDYDTTDWTQTLVDGGSDAAQSVATQAGVKNGTLKILNNDADDDSLNLQRKVESYKIESGKKLWFETLLNVSDADAVDLFVGLAITDTTALDASDRLGFRITDGDASITSQSTKDSTTTQKDTEIDASDSVNVKLGMYYDGASTVEFYVDRVLKCSHTTNIPDDEELCLTINLTNGAAAAKSAIIDYIHIVKER